MVQTGVIGTIDVGNGVGEGPIWDDRSRTLFWVDITGRSVLRLVLDSLSLTRWSTPDLPAFIVLRERHGAVVGLRDTIAQVELPPAKFEPLCQLEPDRPSNRVNEGKVDPSGPSVDRNDAGQPESRWIRTYNYRCDRRASQGRGQWFFCPGAGWHRPVKHLGVGGRRAHHVLWRQRRKSHTPLPSRFTWRRHGHGGVSRRAARRRLRWLCNRRRRLSLECQVRCGQAGAFCPRRQSGL